MEQTLFSQYGDSNWEVNMKSVQCFFSSAVFQETQPRLISQTHPVVPAVQTRETFSASALEIDFSLNITTLDFLVDPDALLCSTL